MGRSEESVSMLHIHTMKKSMQWDGIFSCETLTNAKIVGKKSGEEKFSLSEKETRLWHSSCNGKPSRLRAQAVILSLISRK